MSPQLPRVVEAAAPVVLTRGRPDPPSRFPFAMCGQYGLTISSDEIKMAAEG
jgi:hypothetical protein